MIIIMGMNGPYFIAPPTLQRPYAVACIVDGRPLWTKTVGLPGLRRYLEAYVDWLASAPAGASVVLFVAGVLAGEIWP